MTILTKDRDGANLDIAAENRGGIEFPLNHLLDAAGTKISPATEATLAAVNAKLPALSGGRVPVELPAGAGGLTDTQLRATPVPVSGTFWQATQPVSFTWAGLTDAQLRASALPVSFAWSGLTDAQLRASAVPVSFTWAGLTDAQLRAAAVPVSLASAPLPAGAATEATLATLNGKIPASPATEGGNLATLVARTPALGAAAAAAASPVTLSTETAAGAITTQNLVPNGVATAGSAVELLLNGAQALAIQVTGTYTGALSLQFTIDGSRWETVTGAILTNMLSGVAAATIASAAVGVFTAPAHGALRARVSGLAAVTGTATITLRSMAAPTALYVLQPTAGNLNVTATLSANTPTLAAGTNLAGDVGIQYRANATGAASFVSVLSPATPAAATIKATAGRVIGWQLQNSATGLRSVKVFGVAAPTLGSTAALFEIDIPAGGRSEVQLPGGMAFGTAATYSVTSAKGLTDNTATGLAVNDVSGSFFFA